MVRIARTALAACAGLAALACGMTPAHAEQNTSYVRFQAEHSGKCLTVASGSLGDGAAAVQSACATGLDNQLFALQQAGQGLLRIQAKHSGRCLTTGPDQSWKVQQRWCTTGSTQTWRLTLVDVAGDLYELRPADALDYCLTVPDRSTADGVEPYIGQCGGLAPQHWRMTTAAS
ncbi:RICIN domain-containing protein [Streptomyces halstedii]|uniref:Ricin B lectin domain-containing protein n=1 Tax=Streptomyces halstedii TaxID=1944 RepID=A0A6N9UCA7_STRHA|nr:RICIN domain-containing protein [Streptomyces halstedii]NEA19793.1 hypothetical protein [Streptomyces halstedii]